MDNILIIFNITLRKICTKIGMNQEPKHFLEVWPFLSLWRMYPWPSTILVLWSIKYKMLLPPLLLLLCSLFLSTLANNISNPWVTQPATCQQLWLKIKITHLLLPFGWPVPSWGQDRKMSSTATPAAANTLSLPTASSIPLLYRALPTWPTASKDTEVYIKGLRWRLYGSVTVRN